MQEWMPPRPEIRSRCARGTLAAIYRDQARYMEAQPLLLRLLGRAKQPAPGRRELMSSVDSLAYVEFGLRDFAAAEPLYNGCSTFGKRTPARSPHAGPHLDKMADSTPSSSAMRRPRLRHARLAIRTRLHVASRTRPAHPAHGSQTAEAEDLYARAVEIGDLARTPDTSWTRCFASTPRSCAFWSAPTRRRAGNAGQGRPLSQSRPRGPPPSPCSSHRSRSEKNRGHSGLAVREPRFQCSAGVSPFFSQSFQDRFRPRRLVLI